VPPCYWTESTWADVSSRKRLICITVKQKQITICGVVVWGTWLECQRPRFEPLVSQQFFCKFWSTCGHPHVGPCADGSHMWDQVLVGPCVGGTLTHNYTWLHVGPDPCFLFSNCFVTITLLFYDASLLSSLVPHMENWTDSSMTKQVHCSVTIL
jgi:hypothetical protein